MSNVIPGNKFIFSKSDFNFDINEKQFVHLISICSFLYKRKKSCLDLMHSIYLLDPSGLWEGNYRSASDFQIKLREIFYYFCHHAVGSKEHNNTTSSNISITTTINNTDIIYYWGYSFHITCCEHGHLGYSGKKRKAKVCNVSPVFCDGFRETDNDTKKRILNQFQHFKNESVSGWDPVVLHSSLCNIFIKIGCDIFSRLVSVTDIITDKKIIADTTFVKYVDTVEKAFEARNHNDSDKSLFRKIFKSVLNSFINIRTKQIIIASPELHSMDQGFRSALAAIASSST